MTYQMKHRHTATILIILVYILTFIGLVFALAATVYADFSSAMYQQPHITDVLEPQDSSVPVRTRRQEHLHELANLARSYGEPEDGPIIQALQAAWLQEQKDLSIIAKVIDNEAGACSWEHRITVGAVVLNRVHSTYFPNTVESVVAAPGQYLKSYTYGFDNIRHGSWEAAKVVMDGDHYVPANIIWQDNLPQGTSIWWISHVDTGWFSSDTYFCSGVYGEGRH